MKDIYASIRKNKIKALSFIMMKMMKTSTSLFGVKTQILDNKTNISLSAQDLILSMRKIQKDSGKIKRMMTSKIKPTKMKNLLNVL